MTETVNIPIEKNFYELVEQPNYLKHIIYGDSVVGSGLVECEINGVRTKSTIENLWNILSRNIKIDTIENKEYLFFNDDSFKIQNYDLKNDKIIYVTPKYLMRHRYNGIIYNNYLTNDLKVSTTVNHSFVDIDVKNRDFKQKTPMEIQVVPVISDAKGLQVPQKFALIYGHETKYDYYGTVRKSKNNKQVLFAIKPFKLCRKDKTNDFDDYVYDFEVSETHIFIVNNVLVHNTDSLFIEIPSRPDSILGLIGPI